MLKGQNFLEKVRCSGIKKGDVVYIVCPLKNFREALDISAEEFINSLEVIIGEKGTLVMPAFDIACCENGIFDPDNSPSLEGELAEIFRNLSATQRTHSPPCFSVCVKGYEANRISTVESITPFGKGSVFNYLVEANAKVLLLGEPFDHKFIFFHWLEEINEVPYCYWKKNEVKIIIHEIEYDRSFFRYMRRRDVKIDDHLLVEQFHISNKVKRDSINSLSLISFSLVDFKEFYTSALKANKCAFLQKKEEYLTKVKSSPIKRIDHVAIVSRYSKKIKKVIEEALGCVLAYEGIVPQINVSCQYYSGYDVDIEIVDPLSEDSRVHKYYKNNPFNPLHHIAFEVDDLDEAINYFKSKGYYPIDGEVYLAPKPFHRVLFLSPIQTGHLLIELVVNDGKEFQVYGGDKNV